MPRFKKLTSEKGKKHSKSLFKAKERKIEENTELSTQPQEDMISQSQSRVQLVSYWSQLSGLRMRLKNAQQKIRRSHTQKQALKERLAVTKLELTSIIKNSHSKLESCTTLLHSERNTTAALKKSLSNLHTNLKSLQKRYHRLLAKKHPSCLSLDLRLKGVYQVKTR